MRNQIEGYGRNAILLPKISASGFHFKLFLLLGLLFAAAVFFIVSNNIREEEARVEVYMKNRADVLIWALEGSSRSIRGGWAVSPGLSSGVDERSQQMYQLLLQEVAMQPGVEYLAICTAGGLVLAHSNAALIGTSLYTPEEMQAWVGIDESQARFITRNGQKVFEVVKGFTPRRPPMGWHGPWGHNGGKSPRGMGPKNQGGPAGGYNFGGNDAYQLPHYEGGHGGMGGGHGPGMGYGPKHMPYLGEDRAPAPALDDSGEPDVFLFVGIDPVPYETWLADSARSSIILGAAIVLVCLGAVLLFMLVQNFRSSRRHYYNARSLTLQLFESLPMGLVAAGGDGSILIKNQQASDLLGVAGDQGERGGRGSSLRHGQKLADYPGLDWKGLMQELDKGRPIVDRELELKQPLENDGANKLPVSLSASTLKDYSGKLTGYLFMLRDLQEVSQLKEQVRLGERLSALGNLAAGVAHEIRNPLSSIKGYISLLNDKFAGNSDVDGSALETTRQTIGLMNDEVERLNKVVSELLGVARAGELKLEKASLPEVVDRALRLVEAEAEGKGVSLRFENGLPEAGHLCLLDKDKLLQALLNILINAIQASPDNGRVLISLKGGVRQDGGQGAELRLEIEDNGPGMSYEVQSKIFTPYFTTKPEGTGLGLTITHQIVEQHQGRLEVASLPGKGTRFTLVLPQSER